MNIFKLPARWEAVDRVAVRVPGSATPPQQVEQLREGQTFTSRKRTVTEADIVAFASLTGDLHPLHVDAEWAASSQFGERIASGALVLSFAIGLLNLDVDRAIAMQGMSHVTFTRPVRIGDTLSVESRVSSLVPDDSAGSLVTFTLRILNQDGKVVCRARLLVKWRDDPSNPQSTTEPAR